MLVEVKNHWHSDSKRPFGMSAKYFKRLQSYSELVRTPLYFAVYWARWNAWAVFPSGCMAQDSNFVRIDLPTAMMVNHMGIFGDYLLGLRYPITFRLLVDQREPRMRKEDAESSFTIGGVEFVCSGRILLEPQARACVWPVLLWGDWHLEDAVPEFDESGLLSVVSFTAEPPRVDPNQGFALVGSRSGVFSRSYNAQTLREQEVILGLQNPAVDLASILPDDYRSPELQIWRLRPSPSTEAGAGSSGLASFDPENP